MTLQATPTVDIIGTSMASPYERWCEEHSVRPDTPGVWEFYECSGGAS